MVAELLSFLRPSASKNGDWTTQELAEFYRVEAALIQAGARVSVDRGVSDEGDPWFIFCRVSDGEVIVHFARIGKNYLIATDAECQPICGSDFRKLLTEFISLNPSIVALPRTFGTKLVIHPASLLAVAVATALFDMSGREAVASTLDPSAVGGQVPDSHSSLETVSEWDWRDKRAAAIAAISIIMAETEYTISNTNAGSSSAGESQELSTDQIAISKSIVADSPQVGSYSNDSQHQLLAEFSNDQASVNGIESLIGTGSFVSQPETLTLLSSSPRPYFGDKLTAEWDQDQHLSFTEHGETGFFSMLNLGIEVGGKCHFNGFSAASLSVSDFFSISERSSPTQKAFVSERSSTETAGLNAVSHATTNGSSVPENASLTSTSTSLAETSTASRLVQSELNLVNQAIRQVDFGIGFSVDSLIKVAISDLTGGSVVLKEQNLNTSLTSAQTTSAAILSSTISSSEVSAVSQAGEYKHFDIAAQELLDQFMKTNSFEVLRSGGNCVIFDTVCSHYSNPEFDVGTWLMADGSTITIVGVLPHLL